jgi:hypothetical protein
MSCHAGTVLLSHASNGAAGETWPRCDVDAESCWQQCSQVMLAMTLLSPAMKMLSHAGDNTVESCWRRRCRDNLAAMHCRC